MTMVDWKGLGLIEFPDAMSQEDIDQRLSDQEFYFDEQFGIVSDPGLWAQAMPDSVERGFRKTVMGIQAARSLNPDIPLVGMSRDEAAIAIREQKARMDDIPMPEETRAILGQVMEQDFFEAVGTMISNPSAAASIVGEGLGGSVPAAATTIASVAVPSLFGLALSPFAAVGIGAAAAGSAGYATEYANTLIDHMMDEGNIDVMDVDAVAAALNNETLMAEAKKSAIARGVPIAMVDAAAFALGGVFSNVVRSARVGSKAGVEVGEDYVKVGSDKLVKETPLSRTEIELGTSPTPRSRAAELVGMTGVETGGGIAGEALAQISDEGAVMRPGELAIEGLAQGLIGGPTNLVTYMSAEYSARRQAGIKDGEEPAALTGEPVVDQEQADLDTLSDTINAEQDAGVATSSSAAEESTLKINRLEKNLETAEKELNDLRYTGINPKKMASLRDSGIPNIKAKIAAEKAGLNTFQNKNVTLINDTADQGIGSSSQPESLELSRRPTKSDPQSIWGFLSSTVSRATAASERAAQDPNSVNAPVIREMLNSVKTFFPQVKLTKAKLMSELNEQMTPFLQSFKMPVVGGLRSGSQARGIDGNSSKAIGESLHLDDADMTIANVTEIMDRNNVAPQYRPAIMDTVQRSRALLKRMLAEEQAAGVEVSALDGGYFPVDLSPLFRGIGSNARKQKAIKAVGKALGSESKAKKLFDEIEDNFKREGISSPTFGKAMENIPAVKKMSFQQQRTLTKKVRDVLVKEQLIPTDYYEVMRRRIGQHSIAIPSASRIEPIRRQIQKMAKDGNLTREEEAALGNLQKVTRAIEGRYGTGPEGMPRGAKAILQPIVTSMYVITLGMAGIASLGEIAVLTGYAKPGDIFYGFRKMIPIMSRKLGRYFKPNMKKSDAELALEDFLIYVSAPEMAERFTSQSVVDFSSKVTEKFFLANLLTQITQATRIVAAEAFTRAIDRDVSVLKTASKTSKEYRQAMMRMRKLGVPENSVTSMSTEMRQMAILNGIDMTVMTPDPTNRPLWMSNPYLAPVAMLKSFATAFGNTVGKMVWDEVVVGQTAYGEKLTKGERASKAFKYAMMLSLLMGAQGAIQSTRDVIRNWDDEDEDYPEDELLNRLLDMAKGTMILGIGTPLLDALQAQKYGSSPMLALAGPVVSKVDKLLSAVGAVGSEGEIRPLVREFVRSVPFISVNPGARRVIEDALMDELT